MFAAFNISDFIHLASPAEAAIYFAGLVVVLVGPTIVFGVSDYVTRRAKVKRENTHAAQRH